MKKIVTRLMVSIALIFSSLLFWNDVRAQTRVVIPGTFQSELGCPSDWMPDCNNTALSFNSSTGLWTGTFNIPAGCQQYKVAIDGTWDVNYGENGIPGGANINLYVPAQTPITFSYNPSTHIITTSPIASGFSTSCLPQVALTGSFQDELGCVTDWDANCIHTALIYSAASGLFENDFVIPPGYYQYRAILNGDWAGNNFGVDGVPNGANYDISVPCGQSNVHFQYDPVTHVVTYELRESKPSANTVVLAGSFQSTVGCSGDWQPDCNNTRMQYDAANAVWIASLHLPAGHWEYKFTINNSWDENYGLNGTRDGDNISLDLCSPAKVEFVFSDCYHYSYATITPDQPTAVVIASSFQNELGCTTDWQPDCNKTGMKYDAGIGAWVDTLLVPAGHWEYKFAVNNSWDENYGLYGERNGPAIPLDLCYPAKVAFIFYRYNCYGYGYSQVITNGICLSKFYDANVNGYPDAGEEPMSGVKFTLTGNGIKQTHTTGGDGKTTFTNLPDGVYVIKETVPTGYYSSQVDSQYVYLSGNNATVFFGNVCIGAAGAKGIGFWTTKNGEIALTNSGKLEDALWWLRYWGLRNADGTDFDPYTYAQLKAWMLTANAKNMTNMLSAQLAAMFLNVELGYVTYDNFIYTPGCSWWGNFMNVSNLIWYTNYYLWYSTTVDGKDPQRGYLDCLKTAFDNANKDLTFVQPHPCTGSITKRDNNALPEANNISAEVKIWPNPSNNYFTLRPAGNPNNQSVSLRVYNVNGQEVYSTSGFSNKDYRFGERFTPGIYLVEFIQANQRRTFKLVKQ